MRRACYYARTFPNTNNKTRARDATLLCSLTRVQQLFNVVNNRVRVAETTVGRRKAARTRQRRRFDLCRVLWICASVGPSIPREEDLKNAGNFPLSAKRSMMHAAEYYAGATESFSWSMQNNTWFFSMNTHNLSVLNTFYHQYFKR